MIQNIETTSSDELLRLQKIAKKNQRGIDIQKLIDLNKQMIFAKNKGQNLTEQCKNGDISYMYYKKESLVILDKIFNIVGEIKEVIEVKKI